MAETMTYGYDEDAIRAVMEIRDRLPFAEDSFHEQEMRQEMDHWYNVWYNSLFS